MKAILLLMILGCFFQSISQPPNQFNYQAVARNTLGQNIPNARISLRISILDGGTAGTSVYSETRQTTTNQMGLFTAAIGGPGAVNTSGNFATINWSTGQKFIKVEVDPLGGNNFTVLGNTEMLSVPYALYAVNGSPGVPGPSNVLKIGTVTAVASGIAPAASITGNSPNQILNLSLPAGTSGKNALIKITPEPVGANCTAGGNKIESGLDADGNNVLEPAEVNSSQYVCNATAITNGNGWSIKGNAATNPATDFVGTTDNQPLRFKINNTWAGEIHPANGNNFLGLRAGQVNSSGQSNTAFGSESLSKNTNGNFNTATGHQALANNSTGSSNTAYGSQALLSNKAGFTNTAIGTGAMYSNESGSYNSAIGVGSLYSNIKGDENTAVGYEALFSNSDGTGNIAVGFKSLFSNTGAVANTAVGYQTLSDCVTGNWNTAVGYKALSANVSGDFNVAIGNGSGGKITGSNNVAIGGFYSGCDKNISNTVGIGNNSLIPVSNYVEIGNSSSVRIGGAVGWSVYSDARIKNTITEDVKGLNFILRLKPVTYHISDKAIKSLTGGREMPDYPGKYDTEKIKYSGFVAQEVEKAAKASGYEFSGYSTPKNQHDLYTLSYEQFVVPLVKAVQEQQEMITSLQRQMAAIKQEMEVLKKRN